MKNKCKSLEFIVLVIIIGFSMAACQAGGSGADTFTVTVTQPQGGTINADPTVAEAGATITLSHTPDTDYAFTHYTVDGVSQTHSTFTLTTNVTVSGVFTYAGTNTFLVTFDSTGGTEVGNQTIASGGLVIPPLTTRDGYTIDGWYKESTFATKWNFAVDTVTANITLYAKWNENAPGTVTVTFDSCGGSWINPQNTSIGSYVYQPVAPTRTGYTFDNWYIDADYSALFSFSVPVSTNRIIYAKWTPITYTVTYDKNAVAATGSMANSAHTYDVEKALAANGFSREHYVFAGWNTIDDGSGTNYADGQSVKNLSATQGETVPLYAQWVPITYTVTYNKNAVDATGTMADSAHTYDVEKALTANSFSRSGYTFTGWNTVGNGSGTNYADGQSVKNLGSTQGETVVLYAQWVVPVTFIGVTSNYPTTQLTLFFSAPITDLSANDITITGVGGLVKGALSGSNPYTLGVTGTASGTASVTVNKANYIISGNPQTTPVPAPVSVKVQPKSAVYYYYRPSTGTASQPYSTQVDDADLDYKSPTTFASDTAVALTVELDRAINGSYVWYEANSWYGGDGFDRDGHIVLPDGGWTGVPEPGFEANRDHYQRFGERGTVVLYSGGNAVARYVVPGRPVTATTSGGGSFAGTFNGTTVTGPVPRIDYRPFLPGYSNESHYYWVVITDSATGNQIVSQRATVVSERDKSKKHCLIDVNNYYDNDNPATGNKIAFKNSIPFAQQYEKYKIPLHFPAGFDIMDYSFVTAQAKFYLTDGTEWIANWVQGNVSFEENDDILVLFYNLTIDRYNARISLGGDSREPEGANLEVTPTHIVIEPSGGYVGSAEKLFPPLVENPTPGDGRPSLVAAPSIEGIDLQGWFCGYIELTELRFEGPSRK